jgi:hypothetical protein
MYLLIPDGVLKVPSLLLTREAGSKGVISSPDEVLEELVDELLLLDSLCIFLRFEEGASSVLVFLLRLCLSLIMDGVLFPSPCSVIADPLRAAVGPERGW